ncbi:MAG: hypothetical protein ABJA98_10155 [Acidobacteriota bacterium]
MDNQPRQSLRDLVAKHGKNVCDDPRRCEALLRDACGAHKRELNILMNALRERVPTDLQTGDPRLPQDILLSRLTTRLTDLGLAEDAARWSVDSWALALGVIAKPRPDAPAAAPSQGPTGTTQRTATPKPPKPTTPVVAAKPVVAVKRPSSASPSSSGSSSPGTGTFASRSTPSTPTVSSGPSRAGASPPPASNPAKSGGSSGSGGALQGLWEFGGFLLSIPLLFGSAIVVAGAMFWTLSQMGYEYKQLSSTAQALIGILFLGLTVLVMGAIVALFEKLKELFTQSPK